MPSHRPHARPARPDLGRDTTRRGTPPRTAPEPHTTSAARDRHRTKASRRTDRRLAQAGAPSGAGTRQTPPTLLPATPRVLPRRQAIASALEARQRHRRLLDVRGAPVDRPWICVESVRFRMALCPDVAFIPCKGRTTSPSRQESPGVSADRRASGFRPVVSRRSRGLPN